MKKQATMTLAVILAVTMILSLAACGGGDVVPVVTSTPATEAPPALTPEPKPEPTPEPEPEPVVLTPTRGTVQGISYRSEYLDLIIRLPSGWRIIDDYWIPYEPIGFLEEIPELFWEQYYYLYEFEAMQIRDDNTSLSLNIEFWMIPEHISSEIDWLETSSSQYEELVFDPNQTPIKIGDNDWYVFKSENTGADYYFVHYINLNGRILRELKLSGTPLDHVEQFDLFSYTYEYLDPEAELEAISANRLQRGSWSGNAYSSEYLGFQLTLPGNWKWSMEVKPDDDYRWRDLPEDVLDAILNGEIPKEYWLTQSNFYEFRVSNELSDMYRLPTIAIIITPLEDSHTSLEESLQYEAERIEIGNFRWYETMDVSEAEFQFPIYTPPSCAPGGGLLTTTQSVRVLYAEDVENCVSITILIYVFCFCGDEGVSEDNNEILSWFTPYP